MSEKKQFVECLICGSLLKRITRTHLAKHNISTDEYKLRFPNTPIVSESLSEVLGIPSRQMNVERKQKISEWAKRVNSGKSKSDEHKKKLSDARTGISWGHHSDEHKKHMSNVMKEEHVKRKNNGWVIGKRTIEQKNKLSEAVSKSYKSGNRKKPVGPSKSKGIKLNLSDYQRANRSKKRVNYIRNNPSKFKDTKPELDFKKFLINNEIESEHQFPIYDDGGSWLYDFFIPSLNMLIETDGEYHHGSKLQINRDIIKERIARRNGYRFVRISDKNWNPEIIFQNDDFHEKHCTQLILRRLKKLSDLLS
jgi:very-short-patch-repair endonuclease